MEILEGFELSPQQRRLWQLHKGGAIAPHSAGCRVTIEGDLASNDLIRSIRRVVEQHEILRTHFALVPGMSVPVQVIDDTPRFTYEALDLRERPRRDQEKRIEALGRRLAEGPWRVHEGPLLSCALLELAPRRHELLMALPGLCCDTQGMINLLKAVVGAHDEILRHDHVTQEILQYADVAQWQNTLLESEDAQTGRSFWRDKNLSRNVTPRLPLEAPSIGPGPWSVCTHAFALDPALRDDIEQLCRRLDCSLDLFLLTCWHLLLQRLSGQSKTTVGTAFSGREFEELTDALGTYAKYLPVDLRYDENDTLVEALRQVERDHREVADWLAYYTRAASEVDSDGGAILRHCYEYTECPPPEFSNGVRFTLADVFSHADRFTARLCCLRRGSSIDLRLHADADALPDDYLPILAEQLLTLIGSAVADPHGDVRHLPIVSESEKRKQLAHGSGPRRAYPRDSRFHELVEQHAERKPDAPAVVYEDARLTYGELNARANHLARRLRDAGIGPDEFVGIYMGRGIDLIVAILATFKAGGAYVPLDPAYPVDRLAYILADAHIEVLLTHEHQLSQLPAHQGTTLCLDRERDEISRLSAENLSTPGAGSDSAYAIYTSGSTGKPKGVVVTHSSVVNLFTALAEVYTRHDARQLNVGLNASVSFDASVKQLVALMGGHCLHIIPEALRYDLMALQEYVVGQALDVLDVTPAQLRPLIVDDPAGTGPDLTPVVLVGGEAIDPFMWRALCASARTRFMNVYGPTECTVISTTRPIEAQTPKPTIGRPIANFHTVVLDDQRRLSPLGVAGELHVAGPGLARGYLNQPELTADRFVPNPFPEMRENRLYKTGDLVRLLPNGELEFLGRLDHQVKIRGYRIELEEIETILKQHDAVHDAIVIAREDEPTRRYLAAYYTRPSGQTVQPQEFESFIRAQLPEYMIPEYFVELDAFPLTPNRKIDRRALLAPRTPSSHRRDTLVEPRTDTERRLADVWVQVLDIDGVGVNEDFFSIGGDSIRAIQIICEARKYELALAGRDIFELRTIENIAERLDRCSPSGPPSGAIPMSLAELPESIRRQLPDDVVDAYPLTSMQRHILEAYERCRTGTGVYHTQQSYHITDEECSLDALKQALRVAVDSNPMLRTVFLRRKGKPICQMIKRELPFELIEEDISSMSSDGQEAHIDDFMHRDRERRFDTRAADVALIRFALLRRSPSSFELFVSNHHAIKDGWGNVEMLKSIIASYDAIKGGEPPVREISPNVFKEFVALEREICASREAEAFWRDRMARIDSTALPAIDKGATEQASTRIERSLDSRLISSLEGLRERLGISSRALFLSSYLDVLGSLTGRQSVCVGVVSNGRTERLSDPVHALGMFWNIVPHVQPLSADQLAQAEAAHQRLIEAEPYARYPLAHMLDEGGRETPFFSTFNFMHFHNARELVAGPCVTVNRVKAHDRFDFPLSLFVSMDPVADKALLRLEYDARFFSRLDASAIMDEYECRLEELAGRYR